MDAKSELPDTAEKPMKVIHVIGGGEFGGAEQHIIQLLTLIHTEGVQGKVVCFYEAGLSQALRERGIDVEVLRYGRFDVRLTSGLRQIFERDKPDIIHTHGVKANFFARLAARKLDTPLVTTVHSMLRFDYENRAAYGFARLMEHSTRRWNSHFIAVSNAMRRSLIDEGVPPELVTVVHHGIDVTEFAPIEDGKLVTVEREGADDKANGVTEETARSTTEDSARGAAEESVNDAAEDIAARRAVRRHELRDEWGVPQEAFVIGVIGRLVRIKGVDIVIRALPQILKANPKAHLVIIGSGPEETALRLLTTQLGLKRHITFTGFRRDIADCMRAIDCFASASLSEGLGLNVLEAMSSELPVAVTGVGGILDITQHGVNGLIVAPRSSDDLADAIITLMQQPEYAARLARKAREHVIRRFSLDSMTQRTVDVYRKLLHIAEMTRQQNLQPEAKKLVISGYYGYGNSGDEAVLHAILQALRKESEKQGVTIVPTVLSVNPQATEQMHGVRAISRMNLFGIVRELKNSDGLVSGGGSLLQDITGRMTIPYYLSIIKFAQWFGKPTFIYAQGVGPIETKSFYPFIHYIYSKSQYISVRDQESKELLREIGVKEDRIEVVSDPVMGLSEVPDGVDDLTSSTEKLMNDQGQAHLEQINLEQTDQGQNKPKMIGISVRFWHPYREELNRLAEALRIILDSEPGVRLRFLPFYLPIDVEASQYVMNQLSKEHLQRTDMYTEAIYPQDMLVKVAECDLLIGMRLHSLIYAAAHRVPIVGISYDPKNDHFLNQLGMSAVASTDELNPYEVAKETVKLLHDRERWIADTTEHIVELKQKSLKPAQQISAYLRNKKRRVK